MNTTKRITHILTLLLLSTAMLYAQDKKEETETKEEPKKEVKKVRPRPVRSPFESSVLLSHQTIVNPKKKTLVLDMQHRFGKLYGGNGFDLIGFFANGANIRIGLDYGLFENLQIGIGTTKNKLIQDMSLKWSILQQRKKGMPIFLTVFSNIAIEAGKKENYAKFGHRVSYYHELMIARKFHKRFTLQMSFAYSHFNVTDNSVAVNYEQSGYTVYHDRRHDNFSISALARVKLTAQTSIIMGYDQPLASPDQDRLRPNLSLGIEIATSAHSFQIFVGNYTGLLGQYNMVYNTNEISKGDFLISFNITRLWGL